MQPKIPTTSLIISNSEADAVAHIGKLLGNISLQNNPDILWVQSEETIYKLEEADTIQEHLLVKSYSPEVKRIAIVVNAEKFNRQAANRLLKIMEEPPEGSMIILTTTRPRFILPTIHSRCAKIRIKSENSSLEQKSVFQDKWDEIFQASDEATVINLVEQLEKQIKWTPQQWGRDFEIWLNATYKRQKCAQTRFAEVGNIRKRREILQYMKKYSIAFNNRLNLEMLALVSKSS
jgi:hypothetical protein